MNNIPKGIDGCYVQVLETGIQLHVYYWNSASRRSLFLTKSTFGYLACISHAKYLALNYFDNKYFYGIISIYDLRII